MRIRSELIISCIKGIYNNLYSQISKKLKGRCSFFEKFFQGGCEVCELFDKKLRKKSTCGKIVRVDFFLLFSVETVIVKKNRKNTGNITKNQEDNV